MNLRKDNATTVYSGVSSIQELAGPPRGTGALRTILFLRESTSLGDCQDNWILLL